MFQEVVTTQFKRMQVERERVTDKQKRAGRKFRRFIGTFCSIASAQDAGFYKLGYRVQQQGSHDEPYRTIVKGQLQFCVQFCTIYEICKFIAESNVEI